MNVKIRNFEETKNYFFVILFLFYIINIFHFFILNNLIILKN